MAKENYDGINEGLNELLDSWSASLDSHRAKRERRHLGLGDDHLPDRGKEQAEARRRWVVSALAAWKQLVSDIGPDQTRMLERMPAYLEQHAEAIVEEASSSRQKFQDALPLAECRLLADWAVSHIRDELAYYTELPSDKTAAIQAIADILYRQPRFGHEILVPAARDHLRRNPRPKAQQQGQTFVEEDAGLAEFRERLKSGPGRWDDMVAEVYREASVRYHDAIDKGALPQEAQHRKQEFIKWGLDEAKSVLDLPA